MHQGHIDSPAGDSGGGRYAICELPPPDDAPGPRVDGQDGPATGGEKDAAVCKDGRRLENPFHPEAPEARKRRPELKRCGARALDVVAVHWPGLLRQLLARPLLRLLGGDELRRRRASHRAIALFVPRPRAEARAYPERPDRDDEQRPPEQADSPLKQTPGERENGAGCEQKLGGVGDCAFQRGCEDQGPGQTSDVTDGLRRLPVRCVRSRSPSADSGLPGSAPGS